jgi:hypothetical protein
VAGAMCDNFLLRWRERDGIAEAHGGKGHGTIFGPGADYLPQAATRGVGSVGCGPDEALTHWTASAVVVQWR